MNRSTRWIAGAGSAVVALVAAMGMVPAEQVAVSNKVLPATPAGLVAVRSNVSFLKEHPGTTAAWQLAVTRVVVKDTVAPLTWKEHWFEHEQLMRRVFYNASVAVYYDPETPESITWPDTLLTKVWNYTTRTYGAFGKENRLFVLLHTGKYGGGHPSTYLDKSHDFRNVIDVGQAGNWVSNTGWNLDAAVHEVGHIVEGAAKGVHGSPAFPIWKDSKWMEIYQYDVYKALGWEAEAQRWFNKQMEGKDNFPRPGTQWFRNWFYPIYEQHGGAKALNNFFTLLSVHFPRNGNAYTRDMNWGEFIHFWSGAAGVNLKAQATIAFGWPEEWDAQFKQAQKDFPGVKY